MLLQGVFRSTLDTSRGKPSPKDSGWNRGKACFIHIWKATYVHIFPRQQQQLISHLLSGEWEEMIQRTAHVDLWGGPGGGIKHPIGDSAPNSEPADT